MNGKGGKKMYDWWRLVGGGNVYVDERSALRQYGGEKRVQQKEVEWRQTVTYGGR